MSLNLKNAFAQASHAMGRDWATTSLKSFVDVDDPADVPEGKQDMAASMILCSLANARGMLKPSDGHPSGHVDAGDDDDANFVTVNGVRTPVARNKSGFENFETHPIPVATTLDPEAIMAKWNKSGKAK